VEGHLDLCIDLTEEVISSVGQHFGDGDRAAPAGGGMFSARGLADEAMQMPYPL
jgi:hypothetical protein